MSFQALHPPTAHIQRSASTSMHFDRLRHFNCGFQVNRQLHTQVKKMIPVEKHPSYADVAQTTRSVHQLRLTGPAYVDFSWKMIVKRGGPAGHGRPPVFDLSPALLASAHPGPSQLGPGSARLCMGLAHLTLPAPSLARPGLAWLVSARLGLASVRLDPLRLGSDG